MVEGVANVKDFGAKGNGTNDDSNAIQRAIDSLPNGGQVFFPSGEYRITKVLLINSNFLNIMGVGRTSIIRNTGKTSSLRFKNSQRFSITELAINGNGGAYGEGATNQNAIELVNSHHGKLTNVFIEYNGGHAIYTRDGQWCLYLNSCYISQNGGDGLNSITDTRQENSGQNGNNVSVINTTIANNAGHGIDWAAASLNVTGSVFEWNKKTGICLDAESSYQSVYGANIVGNYFENNHLGQICLTSATPGNGKTYRTVSGVTITGNFMYSAYAGDNGVTALILSKSNGYYEALDSINIGTNSYVIGGAKVTKNILIDSSRSSCTIQIDTFRQRYEINGSAMILNPLRTIAISGLTSQKGIPFNSPLKSDNFREQVTKTCYFSLSLPEDTLIKSANLFVETDAAIGYKVTMTLLSSNAATKDSLIALDSIQTTSTTKDSLFSFNINKRVAYAKTYYLKVDITGVTGGTKMFIRDLLMEIV